MSTRAVLLVLALLLALFAGSRVAGAQQLPAPPPPGAAGGALAPDGLDAPPRDEPRDADSARAGANADRPAGSAGDLRNSKTAAVMFWLFALATIGGAIFIITRRNLVTATMGMVGTFFAIAGLYAMLHAQFLAAIQVLVYAGAIMVLFVFVVMILNKEEDEPWALQGLLGKALALLALLYLLTRIGQVLWQVRESVPATLNPVGIEAGHGYPWGGTQALGHVLFHDYLFLFEAVSVILLIAVVGALALTRHRLAGDDAAPAQPEAQGGAGHP